MKHLLPFALFLLLITSCKREATINNSDTSYLGSVQSTLKNSLASNDYGNLDFTKAVQTRINKDTSFLRIPLKGKLLQNEFVLLQTDDKGFVARGRIITINKNNASQKSSNPYLYNGSINILSLKGDILTESEIINGYITAFHLKDAARKQGAREMLLDPALLPEVVVVGYYSTGGGITYGDWMYLQSMFDGSSGGASGYYGSIGDAGNAGGYGTGGGGSYSGSTSGGSGSVSQSPPILIDFEDQYLNPAIDVQKYINCFNSVPDVGSQCSIEIFADIPVDTDPNKLFSWQTGSPGHTFIQIKKSNGSQSVMQNIGFYPAEGWKVALTPGPVKGKFVDNGGHEFNASLKLDVSPENFRSILTEILYLARFVRYDIDEYNCTDFALDVFNKIRTKKLEIPLYDVPGSITAQGSRTPQGLYNALKRMKQSGDPEALNINIPGVKGWVANSHGPCN